MAEINIKGEIISPGTVKGTLCFVNFKGDPPAYKDNLSHRDVSREISRFEEEADSVTNELIEAVRILKKDSLFEEAGIIKTHILMLEDAEFRKRVHEKIKVGRLAAEIAVEHVLREMVVVLENSENMLFAQRAADLKDIGMRLRKKLAKEDSAIFYELFKDAKDPVLAVKELLPSLVLEAKVRGVRAFIVERGTSFSHAAILAKSFGLPALRIENLYSLGARNNNKVLIDAMNGIMLIDPSEEDINDVAMLRQEAHSLGDKTQLPVKLWMNIVDPLQIKEEDLKDTEGIGLYRTECLFMENREDFPTEDEQFVIYLSLFEKCRDHQVTIRTLDIGGDKILPYFSFGPQENPYLGFRAHRIYRFHPEIFITQARAILRAGLEVSDLRILYPMIETVDDLWFMQGLLEKAMHSLKNEGIKYKEDFKQGILVEVPSAVWNLRELLNYIDFASLGTNDLFQYFFAVDRNNANVYSAYQPESPVALQMLRDIVDITKELNKPMSICGEIASDINFLPLLVGLGFDNLSIDFHAISAVRRRLLSLDASECRKLAQECLKTTRADRVKAILDEFNSFSQKAKVTHLMDDSESIDPICKMIVHAEGNKLMVVRGNKKYYFCCKYCRDRFIKNGT